MADDEAFADALDDVLDDSEADEEPHPAKPAARAMAKTAAISRVALDINVFRMAFTLAAEYDEYSSRKAAVVPLSREIHFRIVVACRIGAVMSDAQETRDDSRKTNTPTRHAKIMRGVVTPILGLIAVACIVFGILNATIWKPSTHIDAQGTVSGTQYIVTDPGVLDVVDKTVQITVSEQNAPDQDVCIAVGSAKDATGWVQGFPYTRVKGLATWETLDTAENAAQGEAQTSDSDVAFSESNMWTQTACGKQSVTMELKDATDSQVVIVDLGNPDAQATIDMEWTRTNAPDFALPLFFVGGLFVILAILAASVFAMSTAKRRKLLHHEPREHDPDEVSISEAVTGTIQVLKPRKRVSNKPYKRHAKNAHDQQDGEQNPSSGPKIVDTRSNNMLAARNAEAVATGDEETATIQPLIDSIQMPAVKDEKSSTGTAADDATTTVISDAELQAYFARFTRETNEAETTGLLKLNGISEEDSAESDAGAAQNAEDRADGAFDGSDHAGQNDKTEQDTATGTETDIDSAKSDNDATNKQEAE